jgi:hypothetical protein
LYGRILLFREERVEKLWCNWRRSRREVRRKEERKVGWEADKEVRRERK